MSFNLKNQLPLSVLSTIESCKGSDNCFELVSGSIRTIRGCPVFASYSAAFESSFKNGFLSFWGSLAVLCKTHYFADFCMNKADTLVRISGSVDVYNFLVCMQFSTFCLNVLQSQPRKFNSFFFNAFWQIL